MPETHSTLEHIHIAAKKEFLEKGFRSASLRIIVKSAGVTTGAFYGYYSSKEELFAALVDEHYNTCSQNTNSRSRGLRSCRRKGRRREWARLAKNVCRKCSYICTLTATSFT